MGRVGGVIRKEIERRRRRRRARRGMRAGGKKGYGGRTEMERYRGIMREKEAENDDPDCQTAPCS